MLSWRVFGTISLALFSSLAMGTAQTPLDRLKDFYEKADAARFTDLPDGDSTWAGRCVAPGAPGRRYGFLMTFTRNTDPILGDFVSAVGYFHHDFRRYYNLPATELKKVRDELLSKSAEFYSGLSEESTGLTTKVAVPNNKGQVFKEGDTSANYYAFNVDISMKAKRNASGQLIFLLKYTCAGGYCYNTNLGYVANNAYMSTGDVGAYCYLEKQVLP